MVTRFVSDKFSREIRLEAALFIGAMSRSSVLTVRTSPLFVLAYRLTILLQLQMFIACDGLSILVGMLDENYEQGKDIIWLGVDCISRVFELQVSSTCLLQRQRLTNRNRDRHHETISVDSSSLRVYSSRCRQR